MSQIKSTSKFLSYVLRHHPESIGIELDTEGWVNIDTLIQQVNAHQRYLDADLLQRVVAENDKKRFTLSPDGLKIRAEQGHSTQQVSLTYHEHTPPELLYHGTTFRFLPSIEQQGLLAGSRHHVHLSGDSETAHKVGQRHGKPVILVIHAGDMHRQGIPFYLTANHVWLVEHVPAHFISRFTPDDPNHDTPN